MLVSLMIKLWIMINYMLILQLDQDYPMYIIWLVLDLKLNVLKMKILVELFLTLLLKVEKIKVVIYVK